MIRLFSIFPVLIHLTFAQGFLISGSGYTSPAPVPIAPCQLVTFYTDTNASPDLAARADSIPLPMSLAGFSASAIIGRGISPAPILSPYSIALGALSFPGVIIGYSGVGVTIQIPCDLPMVSGGLYTVAMFGPNGGAGGVIYSILLPDAIHILRQGDTLTDPQQPVHTTPQFHPPVITHPDGSYVTPASPARPGETVSIWAAGLGLPSSGTIKTGEANPNPPLTTTVTLDFDFRSNAGPSMPSTTNSGGSHVPAIAIPAYFAPGFAGLYQINVTIPKPPVALESCGGGFRSNATVNLGGAASFDGAAICVEGGPPGPRAIP